MNNFEDIDRKQLREFGLITGGIFIALFGLFVPWLFDKNYPIWPWIVAIALFVPALLFPTTLKPVYTTWMRLGSILGWINTRIILGVMFFLIFLPLGILMRIFGWDPMGRKFSKENATYRITNKPLNKDHVERPY